MPASGDVWAIIADRYEEAYGPKTSSPGWPRAQRLAASVDGRILDLACGPGFELALFERGVGIDSSPAMIAAARRRAAGRDLVLGDVRALPFRAASFAGAHSSFALIHLTKRELASTLHELRRLLRPGALVETTLLHRRGREGHDVLVPGRPRDRALRVLSAGRARGAVRVRRVRRRGGRARDTPRAEDHDRLPLRFREHTTERIEDPMPDYDLIIRNGNVIDGTGAPGRAADVAIAGDRIEVVGAGNGHSDARDRRARPRRGAGVHRRAHARRRGGRARPARRLQDHAGRHDRRRRQLRRRRGAGQRRIPPVLPCRLRADPRRLEPGMEHNRRVLRRRR